MALQIVSDLHLETPRFLPLYDEFGIEPKAPVLALLGDIGNVHDERLFRFLERLLKNFAVVLYVSGNHEPYAVDDEPDAHANTCEEACKILMGFEETVVQKRAQDPSSNLGQFIFLDRRRWDLDENITILGCTLFSSVEAEQQMTVSLFVSDFSNIADWSVAKHNEAHNRDLAWLNAQVTDITQHEPNRKIVVLTHFCPTLQKEAHDPEHLEDDKGVRSAFATDLSNEACWTSSAVKTWAFGHTHWNCDFIDEKTRKRVVANQRGYGREDIYSFDDEKVVSLA